MPFNPSELVFCAVCKTRVTRANLARHDKGPVHQRKLNRTFVRTEEPFFCKECGKSFPYRYKKEPTNC